MRLKPRRLLAIIPALALSGCLASPSFEVGYRVDEAPGAPRSARRLRVLPLVDARPPARRPEASDIFLLSLPIIPYVTSESERIDEVAIALSENGGRTIGGAPFGYTLLTGRTYNGESLGKVILNKGELPSWPVPCIDSPDCVRYPRAFAQAIARDLERSKVIRADYAPSREAPGAHDLILSGTLRASPYRVAATTYGLGRVGCFLWYFGLPKERVSGAVELELVLEDTRGRELWRQSFRGEESELRSVYEGDTLTMGSGLAAYGFHIRKGREESAADPSSMFWWHSMALRAAMGEVKPALAAVLDELGPPPPAPRVEELAEAEIEAAPTLDESLSLGAQEPPSAPRSRP